MDLFSYFFGIYQKSKILHMASNETDFRLNWSKDSSLIASDILVTIMGLTLSPEPTLELLQSSHLITFPLTSPPRILLPTRSRQLSQAWHVSSLYKRAALRTCHTWTHASPPPQMRRGRARTRHVATCPLPRSLWTILFSARLQTITDFSLVPAARSPGQTEIMWSLESWGGLIYKIKCHIECKICS